MQQLIISLISGAVGGNLAGALLKKLNLGPIGNSILGLLGGGLGGQLLHAIQGGTAATGTDAGSIIGNILSSGVGGGVLTAIAGYIKTNFISKKVN